MHGQAKIKNSKKFDKTSHNSYVCKYTVSNSFTNNFVVILYSQTLHETFTKPVNCY